MKLEPGMVIAVDVLTWNEGWEFDAPVLILSPVLRGYDSGTMEDAIEDLCIDGCVAGEINDDNGDPESAWGISLRTLRRRFLESLAGKEFPRRDYRAKRVAVRWRWDEEEGGLVAEEIQYATDELYPPDSPLCRKCGRRYSAQEWRAGFSNCEHCPERV